MMRWRAIKDLLGDILAILSIFATAYILFLFGYAMQG